MKVVLTCSCGQRQEVPAALAGATTSCLACGQPLTVPALGIIEPPAQASAPRPRWPIFLALFGVGLLLLMMTGAGLWLVGSGWRTAQPAIAQEPVVLVLRQPEQARETPVEKTPPLAQPPRLPPTETPAKPLVEPPAPVARPEPPPAPTVAAPPLEKPQPAQGLSRVGDSFMQELVVTQKPSFRVQGLPFVTLLQYRVVSSFAVREAPDDGGRVIEQKIEEAQLLQADDLTRGLLAGSVAQLPGTTFTLHLNAKSEVTRFEGKAGLPQVGAVAVPGGLGFQSVALLDADGWKEMAQLTFFQPDQTLGAEPVRWSRPMTHNWGALGSWTGQVHYVYAGGKQGNPVPVQYGLQLAYKPAAGMAAGGTKFQPVQAGGVIHYDRQLGRVTAAEERFHVRGAVQLPVLGQNTLVEIDEEQLFQLRLR